MNLTQQLNATCLRQSGKSYMILEIMQELQIQFEEFINKDKQDYKEDLRTKNRKNRHKALSKNHEQT